MKIKRNNIIIELTSEELRKAYWEQDDIYILEYARNSGIVINEEEESRFLYLFHKYNDNDEAYWDRYYWCMTAAAEYIYKENKKGIGKTNIL